MKRSAERLKELETAVMRGVTRGIVQAAIRLAALGLVVYGLWSLGWTTVMAILVGGPIYLTEWLVATGRDALRPVQVLASWALVLVSGAVVTWLVAKLTIHVSQIIYSEGASRPPSETVGIKALPWPVRWGGLVCLIGLGGGVVLHQFQPLPYWLGVVGTVLTWGGVLSGVVALLIVLLDQGEP